jgi:hypothetical protein
MFSTELSWGNMDLTNSIALITVVICCIVGVTFLSCSIAASNILAPNWKSEWFIWAVRGGGTVCEFASLAPKVKKV